MHIGITGGIGSGKTTICRIFENLGVPVYYADERAKRLMVDNPKLVAQIKATFGAESYTSEGVLNRVYLANIVFKDNRKLQQLNALVHPAVFEAVKKWQAKHQSAPYTLKEAALLFESGSFRSLDKIICVYAPTDLRIERVSKRDQVTAEQVRDRMDKQLSDYDKIALSDFVITNNGSKSLIRQVLSIHQQLCQLALYTASLFL